MPRIKDNGQLGVGVTIKICHEGNLCGDGIVTCVDDGDGYANLYL